jgi:predicted alpha-1,2-mannosidase
VTYLRRISIAILMRSLRFILVFIAGLFPAVQTCQPQASPVDAVNELIGTASDGQTFPATGPPFAMTQWTPQTRDGNVKCVAPYYSGDTRIQGFRGSHFLSGSCTQDYGSMTVMPLSGELKLNARDRSSAFDRTTETMTPYRYAVTLRDYGIEAEITGTTRAGLMRFRFAKGGKSWILVQANSIPTDGTVQIDPAKGEITVSNPVRRLYAGNGKLAGFSGYSVVQFDHPFHIGGTWCGKHINEGALSQPSSDGSPGAYVLFDLQPGETVEARIGTSFTSMDEAHRNLAAEIPSWNFDQVAAQTRALWETALGRIQIQDNSPKRRIFYTALYHSMLVPRTFSDVSGAYPSFAGNERTEIAKGFTYYCDFSLWDTFRALHPLYTIIDPARELDMVKSLIAKGQQGGFLPIYPAWNSYTSEMIGDHADSLIADAYLKGIRGFDIDEAYRLMRKNATELPATYESYVDGRGRRGLTSYLKLGYIPLEDTIPDTMLHHNEQVSRTLEYAYDDFLVGEMAQALGHTEDAVLFHRRAQNYRNVIDPEGGFARGRHEDGSWDSPFDPGKQYPYITEGLPFQYTFFVPQDLSGLIGVVGGRQAFIAKLDTLFAKGYYDHGNEPSHHIAYLYDNAGAAWKTQEHVRDVMDHQYSDTPSGLAGNDDCGQMSAWFVLSALGFYPVTPGAPVYQIGTPLFDDATILLDAGKRFHIHAEGASAGKLYIQSATLNGVPFNRYAINHAEIVAGGELVFVMSSHPVESWPGE